LPTDVAYVVREVESSDLASKPAVALKLVSTGAPSRNRQK